VRRILSAGQKAAIQQSYIEALGASGTLLDLPSCDASRPVGSSVKVAEQEATQGTGHIDTRNCIRSRPFAGMARSPFTISGRRRSPRAVKTVLSREALDAFKPAPLLGGGRLFSRPSVTTATTNSARGVYTMLFALQPQDATISPLRNSTTSPPDSRQNRQQAGRRISPYKALLQSDSNEEPPIHPVILICDRRPRTRATYPQRNTPAPEP